MLAWTLLVVLSQAPASAHERAAQLCSTVPVPACEHRSRCSKDWNPHDARAYDNCRQLFDRERCETTLEAELGRSPDAAADFVQCVGLLYPAQTCDSPDDAPVRKCAGWQFMATDPADKKELVDAREPEPGPPPPPPPDVRHPFLFPVQANVSALGELNDSGSTFAGSFYAGWVGGRMLLEDAFADKEGPFFGIGAAGVFGTVDVPGCGRAVRCGYRSWLGPGLRVGWAQWNKRKLVDRLEKHAGSPAGNVVWPDTYYFVQVTPFVGAEHLPSAPLAPAETVLLHGVRVDLGVNSVELSRTLFYVLGGIMQAAKDSQAAVVALFLLPLALLDHLEFNIEWSNPALSSGGFRAGVSMGAGF